jgi:hypothetical protein
MKKMKQNEVNFLIAYYKVWAKQIGFHYRLDKWKKNFEIFLKLCKDNKIDPYKFLDFMFLTGKRCVLPWFLNRFPFSVLNEFKKTYDKNNISILEAVKKEIEGWEKLKSLYERMGIRYAEHLFLVLKGDVFIPDYLKHETVRRFLNKLGIKKSEREFFLDFYFLVKGGDYDFRASEENT